MKDGCNCIPAHNGRLDAVSSALYIQKPGFFHLMSIWIFRTFTFVPIYIIRTDSATSNPSGTPTTNPTVDSTTPTAEPTGNPTYQDANGWVLLERFVTVSLVNCHLI